LLVILQRLDAERSLLERLDGGHRCAARGERGEVRDAVHQRLAPDAVAVRDGLLARSGVEDERYLAVDDLVDDVRPALRDLEHRGGGDASLAEVARRALG